MFCFSLFRIFVAITKPFHFSPSYAVVFQSISREDCVWASRRRGFHLDPVPSVSSFMTTLFSSPLSTAPHSCPVRFSLVFLTNWYPFFYYSSFISLIVFPVSALRFNIDWTTNLSYSVFLSNLLNKYYLYFV